MRDEATEKELKKARDLAEREALKNRVMLLLSGHIGRANAVDMGRLYSEIFGEAWTNKINDTRPIRTVVTELRRSGAAIGSVAARTGGGYYLMSGSELQEWAERVQRQALRKLAMVARMKKRTLRELLGQLAVTEKDG